MIKRFWDSYITWMLNYIHQNENYKWRLIFMEIFHILIAFFLCLILFYFIIGTSLIYGILIVSIGYGRLIFDRILIYNDKDYPYDKRYTPFLRFFSLTSVGIVTAILTFVLIQDSQNNTSIQKLIHEERIGIKSVF